ncbi:hypothetical protein AB1Y20_023161 [Prymnesium parvum]|uniref:C3H1-type domain-containing protein n=1 Tax=Prymnesium parvum TaxID=97485 RepID=A0AB34JDA8_PRYPA
MAARGGDAGPELRVLRSPYHDDRRSATELAAITDVDALHMTLVENHRSLVQMNDGKYLLARRAGVADDALGVWLSVSGADDVEDDEVEEVFQPFPFQDGRDDSPRLIILGFLQGKFRHGYTERDYWVTDVEANEYGVRAVMIASSPSGALSHRRAVRRTVDEFISAFLTTTPTPARSPAHAARQPAATEQATPVPRLAIVTASLDVSRRPVGKALRLWPRWQHTAPSLADPSTAAVDDLAELLGPLMGREVRGRTAVLSALAKVDGQLSFETRRKTSLRTVIRDLGDVALTVAEVGALFRDHLCPGGTPGGTPAGTPRRPTPRPARAARRTDTSGEDLLGRLGSGDEGDATDSGDSEDDEQEVPRTRGHTTPTRAAPQPADEDSDDGEHEPPARRQRRGRQVAFPAEELAQLTPSGVAPLEVARLFFKVRELAEAASFVLPEDLDEPSERLAYEERAGRAFQRLREMCEDYWPTERERPRDLTEVRQLRERILDVVCARGARDQRRPTRGGADDAQLLAGPASGYHLQLDRDGGSGEKALPPEVRPLAVGADVAERLHRRERALPEVERHGDVGAGIRAAPEDLRDDLARAVGSNGRVDAAGERRAERRTLPSKVKRMNDALVSRVQRALLQTAAGDKSGSQYMAPETAAKLAASAVTGKLDLPTFTRHYRETLGKRAPESDSLDELRGAWKLIRLALMASAAPTLNMQVDDEGIQEIDAHVGVTASATHIPAAKLRSWLQRVLNSWELMWQDFRLRDDAAPSLTACVAQHSTFLAVGTAAAVMRAELGAELREELRAELRRSSGRSTRTDDSTRASSKEQKFSRSKSGDRGKRPRSGRGSGGSEDRSPASAAKDGKSPCAWPDKPQMPTTVFREFKETVKERCSSTCQHFLTGTCFKKGCQFSHEIPDAFGDIKRRYASKGASSSAGGQA